MEIIEQILARIPFWFLTSLPVFLVLWFVYSQVKKRSNNRTLNTIILSLMSGLLIAPIPATMFIVIVPAAYMYLDGIGSIVHMWPYFWPSFLITVILSSYFWWHRFKQPAALSK